MPNIHGQFFLRYNNHKPNIFVNTVVRAIDRLFHLFHINIFWSSYSYFTNEGIEARHSENVFYHTNGGNEIQTQFRLAEDLGLSAAVYAATHCPTREHRILPQGHCQWSLRFCSPLWRQNSSVHLGTHPTFRVFLFLHFFIVTLMIIAVKLRGTFQQWKETCVTAGKKEAAMFLTGPPAVLQFLLLFPRDINLFSIRWDIFMASILELHLLHVAINVKYGYFKLRYALSAKYTPDSRLRTKKNIYI